jgi:two-component system cell cycle response regulator DivK
MEEAVDEPVAKRVLVVEDNELNSKLFCDLLRAHEFVAEPVRDGGRPLPARDPFARTSS